jgi:hypothetical protein
MPLLNQPVLIPAFPFSKLIDHKLAAEISLPERSLA